MAETQIEWTDATWNPVAGCSIISAGCTHCYAMEMARRLEMMGVPKYAGLTRQTGRRTVWNGEVREDRQALAIPYRWRKPRKIFVNSMSDLFHESVSDEFILAVWRVMGETPHHHYQILTKRPARMASVVCTLIGDVLPNVWLGTSVENAEVTSRIDDLRAIPAAIRFISFEPLLNATVQMSSPRWVVARALSLYQMATFSGMAAGAALWGFVTEETQLSTALLIAAGVQVSCIFLGLWFRLPETEDLNLDLLSFREPATIVPVRGRTGPVIVTIHYRIAPEDTYAFLAAMADRRQVRRRNGARRWSLLRDLGDPELWIERYHSPTWTEYVRHNRRFTEDDALVGERIRALHRGPGEPVVTRLIERQTGFPPESVDDPGEWVPPMTDQSRLS